MTQAETTSTRLTLRALLLIVLGWPLVAMGPPAAASATGPGDEDENEAAACFIVGHSRETILEILSETPADYDYTKFINAYLPTFEGVRYGAGGRGCPANKTLINCEQMDCVTFVENVLAMALTLDEFRATGRPSEAKQFARFVHYLNKVRYYEGDNGDWGGRIHYLTDAMRLLTEAGHLKDVGAINGQPMTKTIHYISSHKRKFAGMDWTEVRRIERELSSAERHYYPLAKLEDYQEVARDGDICALTTTVDGLDVSHVGFITLKEGELMLTHASSVHKQIVLEVDFRKYLDTRTTITGIMVYRPTFL